MRPTMETKALDDLFSGLWSLCEIGVIFSKRVLTTLQTRLSKQKPWIRSALTFLATDWEAIDENGIVIVTMHHNTKEQSTRTMAIAIEWSRFIDSVWPGHLINMRAFDLSRTKEIKNILSGYLSQAFTKTVRVLNATDQTNYADDQCFFAWKLSFVQVPLSQCCCLLVPLR